jgi:hypothetical protein
MKNASMNLPINQAEGKSSDRNRAKDKQKKGAREKQKKAVRKRKTKQLEGCNCDQTHLHGINNQTRYGEKEGWRRLATKQRKEEMVVIVNNLK